MERKFTSWTRCVHVTVIAVILGITTTTYAAWTPPIGIPMPPFGINEVAPSPPSSWTSDVPGFYYVKDGGTNPGNGWPANPRNRIPDVLPAGSVVIIGGTYSVKHEGNSITANGTASQPVYIRGVCCGSNVTGVITQKIVVKGSYFIIEHLKAEWANSSGNGKLVVSGNNAVVRHTDLRGDSGTGIGGLYPSGTTNAVLWDNFVHDSGDVNADFDQDNHCIPVGANTNNLWIVDNELARCSGDGIQLNAGSAQQQPTLHHVYVGRNVSHGHKQTGMWAKQSVDVIFSQNTVYDIRSSNSSTGACIGGQYNPEYVWILFNHMYNAEAGVRIEGGSGLGVGKSIFVIGNLIHDITDASKPQPDNPHASGGIVFRGLFNHYVMNNTLWNYQAGIMSPADGFVNIENNILGGRNNPLGRDIFLEVKSVAGASIIRNNLFDPKSVRIQWGDNTVFTNLSTFASATGKGSGGIQADPRFVNLAEKNFQLANDSPAINAGIPTDVYATFLSRYGIDISKDTQGIPRPQGGAFDIGAYEYSSTVAVQPPLTPTNLQVHRVDAQ